MWPRRRPIRADEWRLGDRGQFTLRENVGDYVAGDDLPFVCRKPAVEQLSTIRVRAAKESWFVFDRNGCIIKVGLCALWCRDGCFVTSVDTAGT